MTALRVTGEIVRTDTRTGVKDGRTWEIRTARILIGRADFCDVTLGDRDRLREGDDVDLVVEYRGEYRGVPRFDIVGEWAVVPPVPAQSSSSSPAPSPATAGAGKP